MTNRLPLWDWTDRLEPDVGEVSDRQDVHDAPRVVGGVTDQLVPNRLSHDASRAITTDDVLGAHRHARVDGVARSLQSDSYRVVARTLDSHVGDPEPVIRFEPAR